MNNKKFFIFGLGVGVVLTGILFTIGTLTFTKANRNMTRDEQVMNKLTKIYSAVSSNFVDAITDKQMDQMEQGIYKGFLEGIGDPYTVYFTKEEFKDFMEETRGEYAGIGVVVEKDSKDNLITVVSPFEGSPGQKAGIQPKDKFIKVNGKDISHMKVDEAITLIKGKKGTKVIITVFRPSTGITKDVAIVRDIIKIDTVKSEVLPNQIGYIRITQFEEKTAKDFMKQYNAIRKKNIKGLVIDLRNNPGGLLNVVTEIADVLVPKGNIVYTIDNEKKKEIYESDANAIDIPLVLLVNGNSASASEILSGAVKDYGVGELVGTKTFGKGLVQTILPLGDGSAMKVTTSRYYTPKGVCIQGTGIQPDVEVKLPQELENEMEVPRVKDTQLEKAVEILQNK